MTQEQGKAKELVEKFFTMSLLYYQSARNMKYITMVKADAKKCAKLCVDELIKVSMTMHERHNTPATKLELQYWNNVYNEIEKL